MQVKIYQMRLAPETDRLRFQPYERTIAKCGGRLDPLLYKLVYEGNLESNGLEEAFEELNTFPLPPGYQGSSLSVGDLVEVTGGVEESRKGIYYCDIYSFRKVEEFDTSMAEPLTGIRMLVLEPHSVPYVTRVPDRLEDLQRAVGGYIEITYPFDDNALVIGNEEAKLIGMEGNRRINGSIYAGPLLIAADDGEGGFVDLTDEQIDMYTEEFLVPDEIQQSEVEEDIGFSFLSFCGDSGME